MSFALSASGCAKAKAAGNTDGPPLAIPAPPPRVLAPVEGGTLAEEDNPPAPEPAAPTPRTAARPAQTPPRQRPATTTTTTPPPQEEPKPEAPAPPPVAEPAPRPAPTPADTAADRKVRETLRKAASDLGRVDYQKLSAAGKEQYTQSQNFSAAAEQALKDRNYVFAATVADKAASIATELLGAR